MEAKFYEVGDVTIVEVIGRIEPDQNKPFRDVCERKLKNKKVVFCLDKLSFTASANITTFFESINVIKEARVVGLQHDFYKLLELKGMHLKTFDSLSKAIQADNLLNLKKVEC